MNNGARPRTGDAPFDHRYFGFPLPFTVLVTMTSAAAMSTATTIFFSNDLLSTIATGSTRSSDPAGPPKVGAEELREPMQLAYAAASWMPASSAMAPSAACLIPAARPIQMEVNLARRGSSRPESRTRR